MNKNKNKIYNPTRTKKKRKYLRNNMTKTEIILWSKLKGRKLLNYKFRRQHGIGNYIVDFYCPELNIVIEVDGDSHYMKHGKSNDQRRTSYLNKLDIHVQRFTNIDVKNNINGVLTEIAKLIRLLE